MAARPLFKPRGNVQINIFVYAYAAAYSIQGKAMYSFER